MVIGSEAGALLAWPPSPPINVNETLRALNSNSNNSDGSSSGSSCVWDADAAMLLAGIGNSSARSAVQTHVEQVGSLFVKYRTHLDATFASI